MVLATMKQSEHPSIHPVQRKDANECSYGISTYSSERYRCFHTHIIPSHQSGPFSFSKCFPQSESDAILQMDGFYTKSNYCNISLCVIFKSLCQVFFSLHFNDLSVQKLNLALVSSTQLQL